MVSPTADEDRVFSSRPPLASITDAVAALTLAQTAVNARTLGAVASAPPSGISYARLGYGWLRVREGFRA